MDVNLLIDGIVRQTTVLIAQLATQAGNRTPLAHTANQVFLSLVQELRRQGLGNKVIADMFGLALRTYHDKVQRLSESQTFRGRSLWEAVLQYVQERETATQSDILRRFSNDDERILRSVLSDLTDSGLLYRSGKGDQTAYRVAPLPERSVDPELQLESTAQLLWVAIHRFGPLTKAALAAHIQLEPELLERALESLAKAGKVTLDATGTEPRYRAEHCVIPLGDPVGWEAAVFDHYPGDGHGDLRQARLGGSAARRPARRSAAPRTRTRSGADTHSKRKSWGICSACGRRRWSCGTGSRRTTQRSPRGRASRAGP